MAHGLTGPPTENPIHIKREATFLICKKGVCVYIQHSLEHILDSLPFNRSEQFIPPPSKQVSAVQSTTAMTKPEVLLEPGASIFHIENTIIF